MSDNWRPEDEPPARVPGRPAPNQPQQPPRPQPTPTSASRSISVDVSPRSLRLTPGEAETATISVRNLGSVVDEISLTARGEIGAWARIAPDTLNIYPNTEAQSVIRFAPPKAPRPPAGLLGFEIAVNSARQPDASFVYRGSLELAPFDNLAAAAQGTTYLTARRDAILPIKIRNVGNRATGVYINAADLPGATVALSSTSVGLEPGAETTVWATIKPKSSFLSGPSRQHPFTIEVTGDYAPPITIDGRLEQLARFSRRRLTVLGVLGAGVVAVAGVLAANAAGLLTLPGQLPLFTPQPTLVGGITPAPTAPPTATEVGQPTDTPTNPTAAPTATATETTATPTDTPTPTPNLYAGWESLGGTFSQGVAAVTSGTNILDVFGPWSDNTIYHSSSDSFAWSKWAPEQMGLTTNFKPAAIAWSDGVNAISSVVFVVGTDGAMYELTTSDGVNWSKTWLGGEFSGGPTVASWGSGRLDVFAPWSDGSMHHNWFDGGAWQPSWVTEGSGTIKNAPAAVAWNASVTGTHHIDVFAVHDDGQMYWLWYDDSGGVDWQPTLQGKFNSAPAVTSWAPNEADIFARGSDGTLYQGTLNNGSVPSWLQLTTFDLANAPAAVSWGPGRIDLFIVGADKQLYHRWYDNGTPGPTP